MSESEFEEAIKELARKDFASGSKDRGAYRELCQRFVKLLPQTVKQYMTAV